MSQSFYELLEAAKEALADLRSACRRQGPPRTAPPAASRRRLGAPSCPAPARPPPSRPIMALSLGLGALKRALSSRLLKTSTLHTGLSLASLLQREFRWFGWPCCILQAQEFELLKTWGPKRTHWNARECGTLELRKALWSVTGRYDFLGKFMGCSVILRYVPTRVWAPGLLPDTPSQRCMSVVVQARAV